MRRLLTALAVAVGCLLAGRTVSAHPLYTVDARVTHYVESGWTYGGTYTTLGRTAGCSWDIPLFSRVVMPDGQVFICEDRGVDDGVERIDIYDPYGVMDVYADWEAVEILP